MTHLPAIASGPRMGWVALLLTCTLAMGCDDGPSDGGDADAAALCDPVQAALPVTLHRLNGTEYDNTVRDLLGARRKPAVDFPDDNIGYGFDNIADVLTVSPLLFEKYVFAAESLVQEALVWPRFERIERTYEAEDLGEPGRGESYGDGGWDLWAAGLLTTSVDIEAEGEYAVTIRGFQKPAGDEAAQMSLLINSAPVKAFDVTAVEAAPGDYIAEVPLTPGEYTIAVQFLNEFYDPTIPDPDARSRRLIVDRIVLDGPLNPTPTPEPESRRRLITCQPDGGDAGRACARQVIGRLQQRLGANDNRKLQEYLTGVREFERRLEAFDEPLACEASGRPADPDDLKHRIRLMSDLIVLAFRCDLTRVVTFMLGNGGGNQSYPWLGFADGHHLLSHHMGDRDKQSRYTQICAWEMEELAYLLAQLQAVPEGDGFVLDNTLCYSSSDVEDGDTHSHLNLPILLAGGAGGSMTPGRHLVFEDGPPLSNLLLSMLHMFGVEVTEFGDDSTTPLEGLA